MIYHMWADGDAHPGDKIPEGCEWLNRITHEWCKEDDAPPVWTLNHRRWPAEQRPTAYGLLSTEEQEEFNEVHESSSGLEVWVRDRWGHKGAEYPLHCNSVYRVKEPKTLEFKVTMNGEEVDLSKILSYEALEAIKDAVK